MSELLNDDIMSCSGLLVGTGYPSGSITRSGASMGELSYPCADTGNPAGKISPGGYGYGLVVPIGYIPIAILTYIYGLLAMHIYVVKGGVILQ